MTEEVKHTPGPWKIFHPSSNKDPSVLKGHVCIDGQGHGALAQVVWKMSHDEFGSPECEANARLIAAAPDLLEALKHARDQIRHPDQLIDEAIARAEGRS